MKSVLQFLSSFFLFFFLSFFLFISEEQLWF